MSLISSVENLPKQQSLDGVENDVFQMPNNNTSNNEIQISQIQHAPDTSITPSNNNPKSSENNNQINNHNRESITSVSSANMTGNGLISGTYNG